jgi:hypothetical protein
LKKVCSNRIYSGYNADLGTDGQSLMGSPPNLANSQPAKTPSYGWFRGTVLVLAFVLACQAFWILIAEFYRSSPVGFPTSAQSAAAVNRNAAHLAALFGFIRGDLWAEEALTYPDAFRRYEWDSASKQRSTTIEQARDIAERALAFAPHDARMWLALASMDSRLDWLNGKVSTALRMSYYTGANEIELIPLRLSLAINVSMISDMDFQQLVRHDIRIVVTRKPELKSAVLDAYRHALPVGQQFIEETLKEMDPSLLSMLRSK